VTFELQQFGAQLSCTNAVTDSQGMASCTLTPQEEGDFDVLISLPNFNTVESLTCSASGFFESQVIGGKLITIDATSLILAGAQSFSWMIPVVLSVLGIGLFVVSRKV